jgi:hypothetical protein
MRHYPLAPLSICDPPEDPEEPRKTPARSPRRSPEDPREIARRSPDEPEDLHARAADDVSIGRLRVGKCSHTGSNRGPLGYWPNALTNRASELNATLANLRDIGTFAQWLCPYTGRQRLVPLAREIPREIAPRSPRRSPDEPEDPQRIPKNLSHRFPRDRPEDPQMTPKIPRRSPRDRSKIPPKIPG